MPDSMSYKNQLPHSLSLFPWWLKHKQTQFYIYLYLVKLIVGFTNMYNTHLVTKLPTRMLSTFMLFSRNWTYLRANSFLENRNQKFHSHKTPDRIGSLPSFYFLVAELIGPRVITHPLHVLICLKKGVCIGVSRCICTEWKYLYYKPSQYKPFRVK